MTYFSALTSDKTSMRKKKKSSSQSCKAALICLSPLTRSGYGFSGLALIARLHSLILICCRVGAANRWPSAHVSLHLVCERSFRVPPSIPYSVECLRQIARKVCYYVCGKQKYMWKVKQIFFFFLGTFSFTSFLRWNKRGPNAGSQK